MTAQWSDTDESEVSGEKEYRPSDKIQKGVKLYNARNWDNALIEFLSVNTQNFTSEEKIELAYYLGLCYAKLDRFEEALSYLEQVVTANADFLRVFQCRMTLAYIYVLTDRVKMAEYELKRLQDIGLESPLLFNTLAYSAWIQKQYANAIDFYEKALEIDSENATALNSMGYILADTGMDVMRALRFCRKAVDSRPENPAYLDSLGWAYYKSGDTLEARTWLRRALDISPNEPEIQKHFKIVTGDKL